MNIECPCHCGGIDEEGVCKQPCEECDSMKWYAKHEGTGAISGPMSESEALKIDGLVFNEGVFEQMQVQPPELVIKIVNDLEDAKRISALSLVSTKRATELLSFCDEGKMFSVLERAIDAIHFLSREKLVVGSIEGGVFSLGEVSEGVSVDIRDFDVEGCDGNIEEDDEGNKYLQVGSA